MIAARRQAEPVGGLEQQVAGLALQRCDLGQKVALGIGVRARAWLAVEARRLDVARLLHTGRDRGRGVARGCKVEVADFHGWHLDPQVEAVEQRTRNAPEVVLATGRSLGTGAGRVGQVAAAARIGGRHQHEAAGIADMGVGAGDDHLPGFDRLAQGFQHGPREFRQFVEEQDAVMGKRDFPRFRAAPTADDRGHGRRMMRVAKRARPGNSAFVDQPGE